MSWKNTSGITISFDEWVARCGLKEGGVVSSLTNSSTDIGAMHYIDSKYEFRGFMISPIAMYQGIPLEAKSKKFFNLDDFIIYCNASRGKIFPYTVTYYPQWPKYTELDANFNAKLLDKLQMTEENHWLIRFSEID